MTVPSPWRPRASALGGYFACEQRAAFDRAILEGLMSAVEQEPAPFADLGTIIHYYAQTRLGCTFPHGNKEPTEEQFACAATLFKDSREDLMAAVERAAGATVRGMPTGEWLAEVDVGTDPTTDFTGHIDFLSKDLKTIGDLKTTARKPDHNRLKPAHLYQLTAYAVLVEEVLKVVPERLFVLYVDSLRGEWYIRIWVDLMTPDMIDMKAQVRRYAKFLRGPVLYGSTVPRLGTGCSSNFCPYVAQCRDKVIPPAGTVESVSTVVPLKTSKVFP